MITKILLYYPYGMLFQRGEDRSQGEIEHSSATSLRAANDLGYMAAVLSKIGIDVKIVDYMGERKTAQYFMNDLEDFKPDMIVASITTATIVSDLETFKLAKKINPGIITVAKGAYFFHAKFDKNDAHVFEAMDYALIGECETIIDTLVNALNRGDDLSSLKGIIHKVNGEYVSHGAGDFVENLDAIPFPARNLMNNNLYLRPDTGEPQATIQIDRGCLFGCTFCLSSVISGRKIRRRSTENIIREIEECVNRYSIRNFFFKSDTFTASSERVQELCSAIIERKLNIQWVANSRVNPIDYETLKEMKLAGCWLVAFGIESGSEETLRKIHKNTTVADAVRAVELAQKAGLKIYGFFLFGFPWENKKHIEDTIALAHKLKLDYYEFHSCVLYPGTRLYEEALREGLFEESLSVEGKNYFTHPSGTKHLSTAELAKYRKKALISVYLSPWYILKRLKETANLKEFKNNINYGARLVWNLLRS